MSKIKLLTVAVVCLLLMNLGIVGFLLLQKPPGMKDRRPPLAQPGPKNEIIELLHFDSAQVQQFEILIDGHKESIRLLNDSIRITKSILYQTLNIESNPEKDSLIERLMSIQKEVEQHHYSHFVEIKKLCKADQLNNFNELTTRLSGFFGRENQDRRPPME